MDGSVLSGGNGPTGARSAIIASFAVPGLNDHNALDLVNALKGLSGVAKITPDSAAGRLIVEYDPGFMDEKTIEHAIAGAGYPVTDSA